MVELGLSSTGKITKKADIASSKVYEVLQRLLKKGLVSYVIKNGVKCYDATPPERLLDFLEEKKDEIEKTKKEVQYIIPRLKARRKNHEEINKTIIYTGIQGPKIVLNEILEAGKQGQPHYGFGTNEDPYVKYLPLALSKFINQAKKYKFKMHLLFGKGFHSPNTLAEIRCLSEDYIFPVRTMIYGNKVAIVDFTNPVTTIIIEKKEIAEAYTRYFKTLWKKAKSHHH